MSSLRDALRNGRALSRPQRDTGSGSDKEGPQSSFRTGATWVRDVLVPAIERANAELSADGVAFRLDLNLEPESTNHAHADFWLSELGEGHRASGPKHSLNVIDGETVWLYKTGAQGRRLGDVGDLTLDQVEALLREAAEEFGKIVG
jgi:hypothetical protein